LYDGTNVVENTQKVAVITKIGFDHQSVLGYTLSDIASQKAGIIRRGNVVITVQQKPTVMNVLYSRCRKQKTTLHEVKKDSNFTNISLSKSGTAFDFSYDKWSFPNLDLGLIGGHQVENASNALIVMYVLCHRDRFKMNENKIRLSLKTAKFPGRCEIYSTKYKDVIIDGAHNPQKMSAIIDTIIKLYPKQKFVFLLSFSEGKNQLITLYGMLKQIVPIASKIYLTEFVLDTQGDMIHSSINNKRNILVLKKLGFTNYQVIDSSKRNLENIIKEEKNPLIITGSLYLIGSIYKILLKVIKTND